MVREPHPFPASPQLQEGRKEDRWEIQGRGRKTFREFPEDGEKRRLEEAAAIPCKILPRSLASLLRSVPLQENSGEKFSTARYTAHLQPRALPAAQKRKIGSQPRASLVPGVRKRSPPPAPPDSARYLPALAEPAGSGRCRSRGAHAPRLALASAGRALHRLRTPRPVGSSAARSFCPAFRSGSTAVLGSAASCRTRPDGEAPAENRSGCSRHPSRRSFNLEVRSPLRRQQSGLLDSCRRLSPFSVRGAKVQTDGVTELSTVSGPKWGTKVRAKVWFLSRSSLHYITHIISLPSLYFHSRGGGELRIPVVLYSTPRICWA